MQYGVQVRHMSLDLKFYRCGILRLHGAISDRDTDGANYIYKNLFLWTKWLRTVLTQINIIIYVKIKCVTDPVNTKCVDLMVDELG